MVGVTGTFIQSLPFIDIKSKNCIRVKLSVPRRRLPAQRMWGIGGKGVFNSCRYSQGFPVLFRKYNNCQIMHVPGHPVAMQPKHGGSQQ